MPRDPQTLMLFLVAAVLLPIAAGWLLGHRTSRARAALAASIAGGLAAGWRFGPKAGLLAAVWCFGLAYLATSRGFIPSDSSDWARALRDNARRWW